MIKNEKELAKILKCDELCVLRKKSKAFEDEIEEQRCEC